ncbi:MAG: hypothetical protein ACREJK_01235, partial [Candidatus Methylomirabilales bacterium]
HDDRDPGWLRSLGGRRSQAKRARGCAVTIGGWILLALSWGGIIIAASYCMGMVLKGNGRREG